MGYPQCTTRLMILFIAVTAGCFTIVKFEPALGAWLLLLAIPSFSWTALHVERQAAEGGKMPIRDRLTFFLNVFFGCVAILVTLFVAVLVISRRIESGT